MDIDERYYPYSKYLKKRYGEKVYKLPEHSLFQSGVLS